MKIISQKVFEEISKHLLGSERLKNGTYQFSMDITITNKNTPLEKLTFENEKLEPVTVITKTKDKK